MSPWWRTGWEGTRVTSSGPPYWQCCATRPYSQPQFQLVFLGKGWVIPMLLQLGHSKNYLYFNIRRCQKYQRLSWLVFLHCRSWRWRIEGWSSQLLSVSLHKSCPVTSWTNSCLPKSCVKSSRSKALPQNQVSLTLKLEITWGLFHTHTPLIWSFYSITLICKSVFIICFLDTLWFDYCV